MKSLPSYTQDTTDFLKKLDTLPDNTYLVAMDVKSLYTNIPNDEGIQAVKNYMSKSEVNKMKPVITAFLRLILTLNNFSFNGTSYLQVSG